MDVESRTAPLKRDTLYMHCTAYQGCDLGISNSDIGHTIYQNIDYIVTIYLQVLREYRNDISICRLYQHNRYILYRHLDTLNI